MFANFIYFIIVLLIYSIYRPSETTNFSLFKTVALFFFLIALFAFFTWFLFNRLEKQISKQDHRRTYDKSDHRFNTLLTGQSVTAVVLFAIDIYVLNLPSFLADIRLFTTVPILEALLFITLFVFYLMIIWSCAHRPYQKLYASELPKRSYIFSNISFSIPVLLPWLALSGVADFINVLPFESPKRFLSTTEGELLYFFVFLFAIAMIGPALIQKFWRCKPLKGGFERNRIENLFKKANCEYADILLWPIFGGRMITAAVMGITKRFRYILVTYALLGFLEPEEVDAVIAHEIGHVKRKHMLFYLVFFVGYVLISYAAFDLIMYFTIYAEPIYRFIDYTGFSSGSVTSVIFSFFIIIIFVVYFRYIFGYFMRNCERQADIYAYTLLNTAAPLISTFEKIAATSGQPPDKPNWHHFSIKERIDYLKRCEADRTWIIRHEQKIKRSIAAYLAGILLIGAIVYTMNFGETGKNLKAYMAKKAILHKIEKSPGNPILYGIMGDFYHSEKKYEKATQAYEKSIRLDPENPRILNNLAWLYTTCESKKIRNPKRAVLLAKKALKLDESPHILDTLAESYYAIGNYNKAMETEKRALDLVAAEDRTYYERQLKKFIEAAKKNN